MPQPLALHHSRLKNLLTTGDFRCTGHRWHLTPSVFELLLFDLGQLQLTRLRTVQVHPTLTSAFLVILQRGSGEPLSECAAADHRLALCCRIEDERAAASCLCQEQARHLAEQSLEIQRLRGEVADSSVDKKHE